MGLFTTKKRTPKPEEIRTQQYAQLRQYIRNPQDHDKLATLLSQNPALVHERIEGKKTPLDVILGNVHQVGYLERYKKTLDVLLAYDPERKSFSKSKLSAIYLESTISALEYFHDKGIIDVNTPMKGNSPLHLASAYGRSGLIRWLLSKGADPAATNDKGQLPLDMTSNVVCRHILTPLTPPPSVPAANTTVENNTWAIDGDAVVTHTLRLPSSQRVLTDIFNFETRERVHIYEDETGPARSFPPQSFNAISVETLRVAEQNFTRLTGHAPPRPAMPVKPFPPRAAAKKAGNNV
ncbi:MAG: ankyrin repeat domain-containing protein [Alphaproteobacteria bacterium]|nr:ankyrin repeat domain-containing protein [Alphaproteobacteria bacterium]